MRGLSYKVMILALLLPGCAFNPPQAKRTLDTSPQCLEARAAFEKLRSGAVTGPMDGFQQLEGMGKLQDAFERTRNACQDTVDPKCDALAKGYRAQATYWRVGGGLLLGLAGLAADLQNKDSKAPILGLIGLSFGALTGEYIHNGSSQRDFEAAGCK